MTRKGENIYKRKDGRWEARYIRFYTVDGKAKYGYCYAASYHEVKEKLLTARTRPPEALMAAGNTAGKLFSVYCDEWLILNKLKVKESTYVKYHAVINKHIKPKLGAYRVTALNSFVIEEFSQELLYEKELSPKTVKDILMLLKAILKYTRSHCSGMMTDIEITYPKEGKKEMRVLTVEEQKRLTDYLLKDMDNIKFGVLLTLMTGLRIGEICALRWSDISLSEKVLRVDATMQRIQNMDESRNTRTKIIITSPKSDSSFRLIPLTDKAVELCMSLDRQNSAAFVLSGSPEHFIEPRTLQNKLRRYLKECDLKGVHYHTLRHSFATRCVEVDFEIKSLSEILGHSSPKITLERYVHSSMDLKRNNMNKLSFIGL